jgi:hypothetical protein
MPPNTKIYDGLQMAVYRRTLTGGGHDSDPELLGQEMTASQDDFGSAVEMSVAANSIAATRSARCWRSMS